MKSFHSVGWFLCKSQPIILTDLLVLLAIFSSIGFTPDGADFSDSSRTTYFKHLKKSLFLLKLSVFIASWVCVKIFLLVTPSKKRSQISFQIGTFELVRVWYTNKEGIDMKIVASLQSTYSLNSLNWSQVF